MAIGDLAAASQGDVSDVELLPQAMRQPPGWSGWAGVV